MTIDRFILLVLCVVVGWLIYYVTYLKVQIKHLWHLSTLQGDNMDTVIDILKKIK